MKNTFIFSFVYSALFSAVFFCAGLFGFAGNGTAHPLDFTVLQLGGSAEISQDAAVDLENPQKTVQDKESVPHMLIIGGIQGDEPGGFSAAALLGTHYEFKNGYVTIIPNLNFLSIINRNRGSHGDMNRKFAEISKDDPDYHAVKRVQELIRSPEVDLILNLHDGGGFYHPTYINEWQNPKRWGNSVIIDQEVCEDAAFGNLGEIGRRVVAKVNEHLLADGHSYHLKNTETAKGDKEMEKSLTWFAIGQGKPAFGVEATKNLNVAGRVYYHLHAIEAFLDEAGISYRRDFELTTEGISKALNTDIYLGFMNNRLVLPLDDIRRPQPGIYPMRKDCDVKGNSPILTAVADKGSMQVHYGNNRVTNFKVEWLELDTSIDGMYVELDGERHYAKFGDMLYVRGHVEVVPREGYRLNAIGAVVGEGPRGDESGIKIYKKDFQKRFSVDEFGSQYRLEVYGKKGYAGTFILNFTENLPEHRVFSPIL